MPGLAYYHVNDKMFIVNNRVEEIPDGISSQMNFIIEYRGFENKVGYAMLINVRKFTGILFEKKRE